MLHGVPDEVRNIQHTLRSSHLATMNASDHPINLLMELRQLCLTSFKKNNDKVQATLDEKEIGNVN